MKYVVMSALCLQIMFSAHAMSNSTQRKMQDLYCDFFNAEPYERDAFDTKDWGQPQWDATYQVWRYTTGITVQYFSENNRVKTWVKFPHYDHIVLSGKWEDKRFADAISSVVVKMDQEFKDATHAQDWADSLYQLCNRFNAYAQHDRLQQYDTHAWGNRHWNFDYSYWEYDCGVTVEIKESDQITVVTFPGYEPIRVEGIWYDPRFKETDAPSAPSYNGNLIKRLHDQYARDHIVDDATWGHTKRYNDDLTAYTYVETGIRVDTRSGKVTFPEYHMAPRSTSTVDTVAQTSLPKPSWLNTLRSTLATMCVAALMWCAHHES